MERKKWEIERERVRERGGTSGRESVGERVRVGERAGER